MTAREAFTDDLRREAELGRTSSTLDIRDVAVEVSGAAGAGAGAVAVLIMIMIIGMMIIIRTSSFVFVRLAGDGRAGMPLRSLLITKGR